MGNYRLDLSVEELKKLGLELVALAELKKDAGA